MSMIELRRRNADLSKAIAHGLADVEIRLRGIAESIEKRLAEDRVLIDALIGDSEEPKP